MDKKGKGQELATCKRCGVRYHWAGPCPQCCPPNGIGLNAAAREAFSLHDMEFRNGRGGGIKNGPNYICHPGEVVVQLWEWGYDADRHGELYMTAWLHDGPENLGTLEEQEIAFNNIRTTPSLGESVARLVGQMTWNRKRDTKKAYIKSFLDPSRTDVVAVIAKMADRCRNVRSFLFADRDLPPKDRYAATYLRLGEPILEAAVARTEQIAEYAGKGYDGDASVCLARGGVIYGRMLNTWEKLKTACKYEDAELDML